MSAQTFAVKIPQEKITDLQSRLANTRWPDETAGANWDYGASLAYLKELVDYWQGGFDWRAQEQFINSFANYRVNIDSLDIHFVHERGRGPKPLPLVITHGWPSSFYQMLKLVPLLTDPASHGGDAADSFDVVIPSLPGYGFSERPQQPGVSARVAEMWAHLMTEVLSYSQFGAQGGDMGSGVTRQLALTSPDALVGIHLTDVPWQLFYFNQNLPDPSEAERKYTAAAQKWMMEEGAYAMIQSTKPQTLAYGLNDSPAGLAAWIIEKFRAWSDCGGDLEKSFTKDELLTNVTIYWATETIGSSFLPYYDPSHGMMAPDGNKRVTVPTGFASFPADINPPVRDFAERFFHVTHWTEMPRGGHFAALEEPELLAQDIRDFFRPFRPKS